MWRVYMARTRARGLRHFVPLGVYVRTRARAYDAVHGDRCCARSCDYRPYRVIDELTRVFCARRLIAET